MNNPNEFSFPSNGVETTIISLNKAKEFNPNFRFDAEYFNKEVLLLIDKIRSMNHKTIGEVFDVSKLAGFEYTRFFTKENMSSDNSYIAITSKNVQIENLVLGDFIKIDKEVADEFLTRSKLYTNDVVLSYTGEYRRALVIKSDDYTLGPNVCRLRQKNKSFNSHYLSLFLNSKMGQLILNREKTLSGQPTVAMSRIREVPVPIFSNNVMKKIDSTFTGIYKLRKKSKNLMNQITYLLDNELGLKNQNISYSYSNIKLKSKSLEKHHRIDSNFYQTEYEEIRKYLAENFTMKKISKLIKLKDSNFIPKVDRKYKYLELSSINNYFHIEDYKLEYGSDLPTRARRLVKENQVLVSSIEGSLSTIAVVDERYDGSICTNGFFVCECINIEPQVFSLLLKNNYINSLLKQQCTGTILTNINKRNFLNIELPILNKKISNEIVKKYKMADNLYIQSQTILADIMDKFYLFLKMNEDDIIALLDGYIKHISIYS